MICRDLVRESIPGCNSSEHVLDITTRLNSSLVVDIGHQRQNVHFMVLRVSMVLIFIGLFITTGLEESEAVEESEAEEKKNKMEDASRMNAPLLEEGSPLSSLQLLRPYLPLPPTRRSRRSIILLVCLVPTTNCHYATNSF